MAFHHLLFSILFLTILRSNHATPTAAASNAVEEGLKHMRMECKKQQQLMPPLVSAIRAKDLSRSKVAYIAARPPYEQIEVLAPSFPDLDQAIDARPYVFRFGEDDKHFEGFHLIERALYRDQKITKKTVAEAMKLQKTVDALCKALTENKRYNPAINLEGAVALAFEVPAKKVASEEETFSDLSLMIFRSNIRGIWAIVKPFLQNEKLVGKELADKITKKYNDVVKVLEKIDPKNGVFTDKGDARPYSDVSFPERKTIIDVMYQFAPMVSQVRQSVLKSLNIVEPKGEEEEEEMEEGYTPIPESNYRKETIQGLEYFLTECHKQLKVLKPLQRAINEKNLRKAQKMYEAARPPYEQIEVLAGDFPDLDAAIDARPYVYGEGELDDGWRGMHQIERALYRDNDFTVASSATKVVTKAVESLCKVLKDGTEGKGFSAEGTFSGMITLAYEVPAKKISSEEETWSDLSVMIFRENIKGIYSQYEPFRKVLPKKLVMKIDRLYSEMESLFRFVVDKNNDFETGVSFMKYSKVPMWQRKMITEKFYEMGRLLRMARKALV